MMNNNVMGLDFIKKMNCFKKKYKTNKSGGY